MAEQLLTEGAIDEQFLKCLPLKKAREDIEVTLLANSSICIYIAMCSYYICDWLCENPPCSHILHAYTKIAVNY